jgi:hypothetical protein
MSVISIAIIGKNRQPIYMKEFRSDKSIKSINDNDDDDDLQLFGISSLSSSSPSSNNHHVLGDANHHHVQQFTTLMMSDNYKHNDNISRCYDCSVRQQFILHDAMDYMEQWIQHNRDSPTQQQQVLLSSSPSQNAHDAMFAGLLCPIEDMRVYGMMYHG